MSAVPAVRTKQVVLFPVPCGLCMLSLVLQPFLAPADTSLGTEAQKLSCSRAVGASASTCTANKCVLLSPFPGSLEAMVLTLTWPSHASCLTPALFQRQNPRICCHFKAFVILCRSVILPGGWGAAWAWCSSSAAAGHQMQSLSGTFRSCLRSNLCSCCMQMVACTHRNLPNKYTPCQLRRKGILGWKGAEQEPSSFLLPVQQAVQLYSHSQRPWVEPGRHCLQKTNPTSLNMAVSAQQRCWNSPGPQVAADGRTAKPRCNLSSTVGLEWWGWAGRAAMASSPSSPQSSLTPSDLSLPPRRPLWLFLPCCPSSMRQSRGRGGGTRARCYWLQPASGQCNLSAFVPFAWWCALISPPPTVNLSAGLRSNCLTSDFHSFFHKLISQIDKLKCTVCPRSLNHTGFW